MSRTLKRHDTLNPITGTARDTDPVSGAIRRADLTAFQTIWFMAKVDGQSQVVFGQAINIELTEGAGGTDPSDGLPANRGKWRYQQLDADVDVAGIYDVELECRMADGKKAHFPSREADNPQLTIDPDLDNA